MGECGFLLDEIACLYQQFKQRKGVEIRERRLRHDKDRVTKELGEAANDNISFFAR